MRFHLGAPRFVAGVIAAVSTITLGAAPVSAGTSGTLNVEADEFFFTLSDSTLDPGKYELNFTNNGEIPHEFAVLKLADGFENITIEDLKLAADEQNDAIVDRWAGGAFALPGESDIGKLKLKEQGVYAYFCFIGSPENPHYASGMIGKFTVG